jgi:mono/diheme cytochrome c family protein
MKPKSRSAASALAIAVASVGLVSSATVIAIEEGELGSKLAAADATGELKSVASSNPLSGDSEAIGSGKQLFLIWCAQCHATNGTGGKYGANLTIFSLGYKEFLATVKNGRVQKQMPPWKDVLDEDSIKKIGAYLETLAEPGANWK